MLKSFTLIPSNDLESYSYHPEYPFLFFPSITFTYNGFKYIELDKKHLSLLYHINGKKTKNGFKLIFDKIKNPLDLKLRIEDDYSFLKDEKINMIKKKTNLPDDMINLIYNFIPTDHIIWYLKKEIVYSRNCLTLYPYKKNIDNVVYFDSLISYSKLFNNKKKSILDKILCGTFKNDSNIPYQIYNIVNSNTNYNMEGNLNINTKFTTKVIFYTKEIPYMIIPKYS